MCVALRSGSYTWCKIGSSYFIADVPRCPRTKKQRAAPKSRPFPSGEADYFAAGFTLDLDWINPDPARPITSAMPVKMIPPVLVTPT
jgi:hypothetical protein